MSDRNSGEYFGKKGIPVLVRYLCLRTNFRYCSGIGLKKCFMFPSVPALVTLLILKK